LRMRQWPPEAGKPVEWAIIQVIEHQHTGARASQLPFPQED
jgi:hypothetical protein